MTEAIPLWMWVVGFLAVLGPLVTLHELGHYLVGRWCGVKAEAFSIGFGKEVCGWTDSRGTRWKLSALPLGGYVQFAGDMNPASQANPEWLALPEAERAVTFQSKSLGKRAAIVAAGPLMNFLIAIVILAGFNLAYGKLDVSPVVQAVVEQGAAGKAGVEPGDRVLSLDGKAIESFEDLRRGVAPFPGERVTLTVERGSEVISIPLTIAEIVERDRFGNEYRIGQIGIGSGSAKFVPVGIPEAVGLAVVQTGDIVKMMATGIWQIITGRRSVDELGGPLKIAKYSGEQMSLGWRQFFHFAALISINLAFINLLPIPVLDGGHLAFYAAEAVRRKPASARSQEWAYRSGLALMLGLMVFVTINDLLSLPLFGR